MLKYVLLFLIVVSFIAYLYIHESPTKYLAVGGAKAVTKLVIKEVVRSAEESRLLVGLRVSDRLNLLKGESRAPLILIESNGIPPKYLKLASFDAYDGREWYLNKSIASPIVLKLTYTISWRGDCLVVDALFRGAKGLSPALIKVINSLRRVKYITCLAGSEGILIKLPSPQAFKFRNLTIVPLPQNFVSGGSPFGSEGIRASALISLLTSVIPIPRGSSGNVTLVIDRYLRYLGIEGGDVRELLIIKEPPTTKYLIQEVMDESTYVGNICSMNLTSLGNTCRSKFMGLIKDAVCSKVMAVNYVALASALRRLTQAIDSEVTYGSVDLSRYRLGSCRDYTLAFLFIARKGTCIHYASALALALKELGFNARVAVGLLRVKYVRLEGNKYASIYSPHAWVEVMTKHGYISYDPTPPTYRSAPLVVVVKELSNLVGPSPTYLMSEPYPGVKVMLTKLGGPYSRYYGTPWYYRISKSIEAVVMAVTPYLLTIGTAAIIAYLILTHQSTALRLIAKLKSITIRRKGNIAEEVINAVYGSLGLRPSKYSTIRELIEDIKDLVSEDLRYSLMRFLRTYEGYRFGSKGELSDVVKTAKEVLSRIASS